MRLEENRTEPVQRLRVRVEGTVQGVGFRPFVYRLADELALSGHVRNDERGVEVDVEGEQSALGTFLQRLVAEAPRLASVDTVCAQPQPVQGRSGFQIAPSVRRGQPDAPVSPDVATCPECLAELLDPADRRYRYPFINCTSCGPRFTIVRGVPYDRAATTMACFAMCSACRDEYEDPRDRRFHAQPNACWTCGPQLQLLDGDGSPGTVAAGQEIAALAAMLAAGAIVAIKGLGGYHLACRADGEEPVQRLRARKHRQRRPFALLVADLPSAAAIAHIGAQESRLLCDRAAPIVLARRRARSTICAEVAPAVGELGLMLPYTPIHHLLMRELAALEVGAIVCTSANLSDEPICAQDEEATRRLAGLADAFLVHDRPIHMATDDSVARIVRVGTREQRTIVRRSRGYAPRDLRMPLPSAPLLACGAELKSTFCLSRDHRGWVSHHIGDLRNWDTLRSFRAAVAHFEALFALTPELVVHDMHPDYLSSAYARERAEQGLASIAVQHHHAHLAAVLAEHGVHRPAVAAIFDGAGLGADGTVWGGELLVGDLAGFERAGHLRCVPLPGGDICAREPWRMACSWLTASGGSQPPEIPPALEGAVSPATWSAVAELAAADALAPLTSSVGRLFDAVAAVCGTCPRASYEGQAAVELEALADRSVDGAYEVQWCDGVLDPTPALLSVCGDLARGRSVSEISACFHNGLARASAAACAQIAREHALHSVVLSGGVFQNSLLLQKIAAALDRAGLRVMIPHSLPANDAAISFGQAAVAAATLLAGVNAR